VRSYADPSMRLALARGRTELVPSNQRASPAVALLTRIALVACVLLWAANAHAARIAVLRHSGASPEISEAVFRIQGELLALGLEVELADRAPSATAAALDSRTFLERMASERGIDAAVDVVGDTAPTAVDIWIFERSPRRSEVSRVTLEPNAQNAAETLAIRAIEVLRSSFVEIDLAARARLDGGVSSPPRKPSPELPEKEEESFALEAGGAVLTSFDGVGPAILPLARFDWALGAGFLAQATLAGFGTRPTIEMAVGSAEVAQHYAVVGLGYASPIERGITPLFSLSAGALQTSITGRADPPEQAHSVGRWSLLLDLSLGARLSLSARYYLALATHLQLAQPYVAIHFVDRRVGSTGRPNVLFSVTAGVWL
jgi:hypothetical protein